MDGTRTRTAWRGRLALPLMGALALSAAGLAAATSGSAAEGSTAEGSTARGAARSGPSAALVESGDRAVFVPLAPARLLDTRVQGQFSDG